ncbi:type II secretion system minor pseudopilin GspH [Iodobacter ciconiae]|uniref:Type II secretion system protein H n=1 Tax=Iodobacter ciconiae TaxID=2496266 RepID=A0A3S8ZRD5_9NEIS|nr:type II secretion system minor pseudopilin GspH [Iodobacter ciconiae]AZN36046.1 type II secretion system protein GspH [Iodobacter ciconiae]
MKVMRQLGFTLIEILVVLSIIGIIMGLAVVRLDLSDGQRVEREASRLASLFESARDEAITSGQTIAWSSDGQGYQFWLQDAQNNWQSIAAHDLLNPRVLEEVQVEGFTVNLREQRLGERLVFEPSGVNVPFSLRLRLNNSRLELVGDVMGRVEVRRPDASETVALPHA